LKLLIAIRLNHKEENVGNIDRVTPIFRSQ
jgi:hypothetical protein